MALDRYYLLGDSGLRVSRLALGTMNFGTAGYHAAYGRTLDESRPSSVATSRRAATSSTPPTSTPQARARPSSGPSWYAARAQSLAAAHFSTPLINLQLPYSLIERQIEVEHVTMAQTLGLGITAWSPLGGGFLSGKYRSAARGLAGDGRLSLPGASGPVMTDRQWRLLDLLAEVADALGVTMAQVAVNWVATQPGIAAAIVGASSAKQLGSTISALDVELPAELRAKLDDASAVAP